MSIKNFANKLSIAAIVMFAAISLAPSAIGQSNNGIEQEDDHSTLVGTWRVQVTVRDCQTGAVQRTFPGLFAFAKGGTLTEATGGQPPSLFTPGFGVWRHTEGRIYSAVFEAFVFSPAGVWIQTNRYMRTIELDRGANDFTDTIKLEIFDTSGNLIAQGCGTSVARRFE
jgi:hypothetical protein